MRARRVKREDDKRTLVFFGSYGKNQDGTAKFYNENDKHDNFSSNAEAIADTLLVKLNILQGELWRNISYGWPLWENHKTQFPLDAYLTSTILKHQYVIRINDFSSKLHRDKNSSLVYIAQLSVTTSYGDINLDVSQPLR